MEFHLIKNWKNAEDASGLTIVIDVFRAFSTSCLVISKQPKSLVIYSDLVEFEGAIRRSHKRTSIGERGGTKLSFVDYGNSPSEIAQANLYNQNVLMSTSCGTKGILGAKKSTECITGSFCNIHAIIDYIKTSGTDLVSLICTNDYREVNEDTYLAEYIIKTLKGENPNLSKVIEIIKNSNCCELFNDQSRDSHPIADLEYCLNPNLYDFVVCAHSRTVNTATLSRIN